ncbi:MAG: PepSY domain-containing protein, partial [Lachnospiraceae bacterium]|nr:PepSY domain-containing protein [Lachnospiraceae bacterium]
PTQTQPGSGSTQTNAQMSADEAFQKALAEAGGKEADAFLKKNHIDWENGTQVYEIEFYVKNADGSVTEYEYAVNAITGEVVERGMEQERVQTTPQPKPQAPAQTQPGSGSSQAQTQPAPQAPAAPQQPVTTAPQQGDLITVDEAKSIALSHAGVGSGATFVKTELDHDDGRMVYEIEFYVGWTEYNVDVDAVSGAVVGFDIDYEDYD